MEINFVGQIHTIEFTGSPDTCTHTYYTVSKEFEKAFNDSNKDGNFQHVVGVSLDEVSWALRLQLQHYLKCKSFKFTDFKFSVIWEKVENNMFWLPKKLGYTNWYGVHDEKDS